MVEKIRVIPNTKQKLVSDPILQALLKIMLVLLHENNESINNNNNFQKNIMVNLEKIWNYAKHRDKNRISNKPSKHSRR
jgi:hypothetical protein